MDVRLLPCPFCGGLAQLWHQTKNRRGFTFIQCDDALCNTTKHGIGNTKDQRETDAIKTWNRRVAVALNAPVVDSWRPISTAPEGQLVVVGWSDCDGGPPDCLEFDCKDDGVWSNHEANVEHADAAAPPGSILPSRDAPYQWWLPIPQFPNTAALESP